MIPVKRFVELKEEIVETHGDANPLERNNRNPCSKNTHMKVSFWYTPKCSPTATSGMMCHSFLSRVVRGRGRRKLGVGGRVVSSVGAQCRDPWVGFRPGTEVNGLVANKTKELEPGVS